MQQSGNPALGTAALARVKEAAPSGEMTKTGTYLKTALLLVVVAVSAGFSWNLLSSSGADMGSSWLWLMLASFAALIIGLVISFKPTTAPILSIPYAVLQGGVLGAISGIYATAFDGIVQQAVLITMAIFVTVWFGYSIGILRATPLFVKAITFSIVGILVYYLFTFLFGWLIPTAFFSSGWAIAISVFIVIVAALSLVMDFDFIDRAADAKAPKAMEWYGAFGLMVGLIWLYLEILRLLGRIAARSR